jgi:hypothetical protein
LGLKIKPSGNPVFCCQSLEHSRRNDFFGEILTKFSDCTLRELFSPKGTLRQNLMCLGPINNSNPNPKKTFSRIKNDGTGKAAAAASASAAATRFTCWSHKNRKRIFKTKKSCPDHFSRSTPSYLPRARARALPSPPNGRRGAGTESNGHAVKSETLRDLVTPVWDVRTLQTAELYRSGHELRK